MCLWGGGGANRTPPADARYGEHPILPPSSEPIPCCPLPAAQCLFVFVYCCSSATALNLFPRKPLQNDGSPGVRAGGGGGQGRSLRNQIFFLLRTALKDRPKGPPTANRQLPSTANRHQPPTTNRHQPPTTNRRQPPAATNRQLPTTANRHQPPITNHQPPPTTTTATNRQLPTANRRQPPTANHQPPPTMVEHMQCPRAILGKLVPEHFFFPVKDRPGGDGGAANGSKRLLPAGNAVGERERTIGSQAPAGAGGGTPPHSNACLQHRAPMCTRAECKHIHLRGVSPREQCLSGIPLHTHVPMPHAPQSPPSLPTLVAFTSPPTPNPSGQILVAPTGGMSVDPLHARDALRVGTVGRCLYHWGDWKPGNELNVR